MGKITECFNFKIGDVVCLKSDLLRKSPMTVSGFPRRPIPDETPIDLDEYFSPMRKPQVTLYNDPNTVLVEWLNSQRKVEREEFYPEQLQKI
jgi:uncharacterized protein YodC (DUF2158 family)